MDVHELTSIAAFFIIATIDNERQAKAIEDMLLEKLKIQQEAENARMAELYRKVVLKEQKPEGFVSLNAIKPAEKQEEVGSFGD